MSGASQHQNSSATQVATQSMTSRILSRASEFPTSVLYLAGESEWTAGRIADDALQLAFGMLASGVRPGDQIVTQVGNRPEAAVILLACLVTGTILVPLPPRYKSAEVTAILSKLRPSLYFCEAQYYASFADVPASVVGTQRRFIIGNHAEGIGLASWHTLKREVGEDLPVVDLEAPAVLVHTSGTTGEPKLVVHTQASLARIVERVAGFNSGNTTKMLVTLSCANVSALTSYLTSMVLGRLTVLLDGFEPNATLDAIEKHRCTTVFLTPHMAHLINQAQRSRPRQVDSLVFCVCSGDVCHPSIKEDFARLFGRTLHTSWGMTEAIGTLRVGQTPGAYAAAPDCAHLVDDQGHPVDDGEAGELVIRDSTLFKGYWLGAGQIDGARKNGWFHTGDIMRKDGNGDLHYVARKKDLIINDGRKVAPAEIEHALLMHPAVAEVAVVGVQDLSLGQRIVGFVVLDASCRVAPDEILRELATRLADYKVPERLFVVAQIPRNELGKAIRPLLIGRALDLTLNR